MYLRNEKEVDIKTTFKLLKFLTFYNCCYAILNCFFLKNNFQNYFCCCMDKMYFIPKNKIHI